jgi:hypothetical protein
MKFLDKDVFITVGFSIDAEINSIRVFDSYSDARAYANGDYDTDGCYPMIYGLSVYRVKPGSKPEYCDPEVWDKEAV